MSNQPIIDFLFGFLGFIYGLDGLIKAYKTTQGDNDAFWRVFPLTVLRRSALRVNKISLAEFNDQHSFQNDRLVRYITISWIPGCCLLMLGTMMIMYDSIVRLVH